MELWATWSSERCPCSWQGGWNQMIFKVPSNPYYSMILWLQDLLGCQCCHMPTFSYPQVQYLAEGSLLFCMWNNIREMGTYGGQFRPSYVGSNVFRFTDYWGNLIPHLAFCYWNIYIYQLSNSVLKLTRLAALSNLLKSWSENCSVFKNT